MTQREWDDWKNRPIHKVVFQHAWGWQVLQSGGKAFRLHCQKFGYIGTFGSCEAAISYMNNEFL